MCLENFVAICLVDYKCSKWKGPLIKTSICPSDFNISCVKVDTMAPEERSGHQEHQDSSTRGNRTLGVH